MANVTRQGMEVILDQVEEKVGFDLQRKIVENITRRGIVDTGRYRSSWQVSVEDEDTILVFSDVKYGRFLEFGTQPHFPPVDELKPWVRRVFGLSDEEEIDSAAWAVARKIAQEGTPPRPHVRPAVQDLKQEYS